MEFGLICVLKTAACLWLMLDVRVATLDGNTSEGVLKSLDEDQLVVATNEKTELEISVDEILTVDFPSVAKPAGTDPLRVFLADGSSVPAQNITATAQEITAKSSALGDVSISREAVRAVTLQAVAPDSQPQWNAFLARENDRDMLVVEKRDGSGLDFLAGIVSAINESEVPFLLDGSEIPVPRKRIVGVVFAKTKAASKKTQGVAVELGDGSIIRGREVFLEDSKLCFESSWEQFVEIDIDQIAKVDFSSGRIHYLSDLDPIVEKYFGLEPSGQEWGTQFEDDRTTRSGLSTPWRMSRDRFPNSGRPPLSLQGRRFKKGVCIFPSARIDYALDGQYSSLKALVGIDDDVAFNQQDKQKPTAVELRIEADGEPIYKALIKALDQPVPLNLKLDEVSTLSIYVDFGDGSSICDYLDLADAKLIVDNSSK